MIYTHLSHGCDKIAAPLFANKTDFIIIIITNFGGPPKEFFPGSATVQGDEDLKPHHHHHDCWCFMCFPVCACLFTHVKPKTLHWFENKNVYNFTILWHLSLMQVSLTEHMCAQVYICRTKTHINIENKVLIALFNLVAAIYWLWQDLILITLFTL